MEHAEDVACESRGPAGARGSLPGSLTKLAAAVDGPAWPHPSLML